MRGYAVCAALLGWAVAVDARIQEIISLFLTSDRYLDLEDPLDELSKSVNLSSSRVRHIFRVQMGMTWGEFVKDVRIQKAKILLAGSYLRVKEVSGRVGINDVSQFVREFRRAVGMTPGQYRTSTAIKRAPEIGVLSTTNPANK